MKAEEWEKIKSLFDAVLKINPAERADWLNDACCGRTDILETVQQLVRNYEDPSTTQRALTEQEPVFSPGELVAGRFVIVKLIARGGMGDVYEVHDMGLRGIRIALKTVRPGIANQQQAYERFKREVWVAREIDHSAICRIFDLFEHRVQRPDGTELVVPCLTMRLLEGENLGQF
jgi:serine/threonine protein kinase